MQPLLVADAPGWNAASDIEKPSPASIPSSSGRDQPQAIDELCAGLGRCEKDQVLLGVTGSGENL